VFFVTATVEGHNSKKGDVSQPQATFTKEQQKDPQIAAMGFKNTTILLSGIRSFCDSL
jgi:hypothetical protein